MSGVLDLLTAEALFRARQSQLFLPRPFSVHIGSPHSLHSEKASGSAQATPSAIFGPATKSRLRKAERRIEDEVPLGHARRPGGEDRRPDDAILFPFPAWEHQGGCSIRVRDGSSQHAG